MSVSLYYTARREQPITLQEQSVILDGSTKLPTDGEEELILKILDWWLECLEERPFQILN